MIITPSVKDKDIQLSQSDIDAIQRKLKLKFPDILQCFFLRVNGGRPAKDLFNSGSVEAVVSEFLPLVSGNDHTAVQTYEHLVLKLGLLPKKMFPIAVEPTGDYFFIDCKNVDCSVYLFRHELGIKENVVDLGVTFGQFLERLEADSDLQI